MTILVMMGVRTEQHCLRSQAGIAKQDQNLTAEADEKNLRIIRFRGRPKGRKGRCGGRRDWVLMLLSSFSTIRAERRC